MATHPKQDSTGTYPAVRPANGTVERPGTVKCRRPGVDPEELDEDLFAARELAAFMSEVGLTNVAIAKAWDCSESIVRDVKSRHKPFTVSKLARMPDRGRFIARLFAAFDRRTRAA